MTTDLNNRFIGVSVIMPVFNLADFVTVSVESVLSQSHSELELIIIDDCSTDQTWSIIKQLATHDKRIRVLRSQSNMGAACARNLGLTAARFRYVAFIDGDDLWRPDKLALQLKVLQSGTAQLSYTAVQKVNSMGRSIGRVQQVLERVNYRELLANPLIACSSVVLDYDSVRRVLMPQVRKRQDFAFWLQLLRAGTVASGINEPLTYYRVRRRSLSSNKVSAALYTWKVYRSFERLPLSVSIPSFVLYACHGFRKMLNR